MKTKPDDNNHLNPYNEEIAHDYDRNSFIWKLYLPLLKSILKQTPRQCVLDLGCGTGSLLIAVRSLVHAGKGIDISPPMIDRATQKTQRLRIRNLEFETADILGFNAERD